ncbi:MAG TPA: universal stress protein [Puia sp.]|uniref:universal stress protein n=1 Tax=Puia sp. TaxID=2045100 RepID=UPI002C2A98D1|nr:universal stress protein [Puia sp.]HVU94182.1 universal stress protein [Puia sp.]
MEKILIAIDSHDLDPNSVSFACHIAKLTQSKLSAVFLDDRRAARQLAFEAITEPTGIAAQTILEATLEQAESNTLRENNMLRFKQLATEEGVRSTIYLDRGVPAKELIAESLFADLLILDANTFGDLAGDPPSGFVKDIVHDAGCPVLIAPENFNGIDNIVFCYDGGRSSLYAMKQFAHLFPSLAGQRTKVVDLHPDSTSSLDQARIVTWLKTHFAGVDWLAVRPDEAKALFNFLSEKGDDIVVMGAYGKGLLSSFFTEDGQLGITRTTRVPLFITQH